MLRTVGGLNNEELVDAFNEVLSTQGLLRGLLNCSLAYVFSCASAQSELDSFLIEISALILAKKDEDGKTFLVNKILDKTGMKGTGAGRAHGCDVPLHKQSLLYRWVATAAAPPTACEQGKASAGMAANQKCG